MSAITAANAVQRSNPPLEYKRTAIREHLQFHATNGPAHVQIQATKALARMIGLYDDAKSGINHTVDQAKERARDGALSISQRVAGLMNGTIKATPEEIAASTLYNKPGSEEDDEASSAQDDDDVP